MTNAEPLVNEATFSSLVPLNVLSDPHRADLMEHASIVSLSPSEITGVCGRLKCCLVYEYEQYVEARKQMPKRGKQVGTPEGDGVVKDIRPLSEEVVVDVSGKWHTFRLEQLEPLAELKALKDKAEAGCSKHEGGGCDCGAKN